MFSLATKGSLSGLAHTRAIRQRFPQNQNSGTTLRSTVVSSRACGCSGAVGRAQYPRRPPHPSYWPLWESKSNEAVHGLQQLVGLPMCSLLGLWRLSLQSSRERWQADLTQGTGTAGPAEHSLLVSKFEKILPLGCKFASAATILLSTSRAGFPPGRVAGTLRQSLPAAVRARWRMPV